MLPNPTATPGHRVESNLLQSIESSHISSNQSSQVKIPIESSLNQNERARNHRLRPRRVHSTLQPLPVRHSDAPRLRKSHHFNRCNPRQPDPHPRRIFLRTSRPSCQCPAPASPMGSSPHDQRAPNHRRLLCPCNPAALSHAHQRPTRHPATRTHDAIAPYNSRQPT